MHFEACSSFKIRRDLRIQIGWASGLVWTGAENLGPTGSLFVFSSNVYFIRTCFFVLIVLHFAILCLLTPHNTNIYASGGIRTRNPQAINRRPHLRPRF